jgi:hypothetical protein
MTDWTRKLDEPILVSKGRQLVTLRDAGDYVAELPQAEHMYFNELLIEVNLVLSFVPSPFTTAIIASAMPTKSVPPAATHIGPSRTRNGI